MSRSPSNATALEQLRRQEMMAHNAPIIAGKSVIPGGSVIPGQERLQQLMPYSACDVCVRAGMASRRGSTTAGGGDEDDG
jgi:hypothetical protein